MVLLVVTSLLQYYRVLDLILSYSFDFKYVFKALFLVIFAVSLSALATVRVPRYAGYYFISYLVYVSIQVAWLLRDFSSVLSFSDLFIITLSPLMFFLAMCYSRYAETLDSMSLRKFPLAFSLLLLFMLTIEASIRWLPDNYPIFQQALELGYFKTSFRLSGPLFDQNRWAIVLYLIYGLIQAINRENARNTSIVFSKITLILAIVLSGSKIAILVLFVHLMMTEKLIRSSFISLLVVFSAMIVVAYVDMDLSGLVTYANSLDQRLEAFELGLASIDSNLLSGVAENSLSVSMHSSFQYALVKYGLTGVLCYAFLFVLPWFLCGKISGMTFSFVALFVGFHILVNSVNVFSSVPIVLIMHLYLGIRILTFNKSL